MDPLTYYRWPEIFQMIRELQPDAHIHGDIGPDSRWGGNENGEAGDPCWTTVRRRELMFPAFNQTLNLHGHRDGDLWMPSELPHSIRCPKWFWREGEDQMVESPEKLFQTYLHTVGRGAALLLGLTPDTHGRIPDADVRALRGLRLILDETFRHNLAAGARLIASNVRGNQPQFAPINCLDGRRDTYWSTDDAATATEIILDFGKPTIFNLIDLREYLPPGQRIDAFAFDRWQDGQWTEFVKGTSIGNRRLILVPDVTTTQVRLRITKAAAAVALSELGFYHSEKGAL